MAVNRLIVIAAVMLLYLTTLSTSSPSPPLPRSSRSSSRIVFPGQPFRRESSEEEEEIDLAVLVGARDGLLDVSGERSAALHFPSSSSEEDDDELESEEVRRVRPQSGRRRKRIKNRNKNKTEEEEMEEEIIKQNDESFCDGDNGAAGEHGVYCEDPVVYPKEIVDALLAKMEAGGDKKLRAFFNGGGKKEGDKKEGGFGGGGMGGGGGGGGGDGQRRETNNRRKQQVPFSAPPDFEPRLPVPQGKDKMSVPISASASSSEDANGNKAFDSDSSYAADSADDEEYDEDSFGLRGGFAGGRTGSGGGVTADEAEYDLADDNATNTDSVFYGTTTTELPTTPAPPVAQSDIFERETPLCRAHAKKIFPRRGLNKDNHYRFIINDPDTEYLQSVLIETCLEPDSACTINDVLRFSDFGVKTVCRQKYIYRTLLAIDEDGTEVVDEFRFPSCCVCHVVERTPFTHAQAPLVDVPRDNIRGPTSSSQADIIDDILASDAASSSASSSSSERMVFDSVFSDASGGASRNRRPPRKSSSFRAVSPSSSGADVGMTGGTPVE